MRMLSNTETELRKSVAYKKACIYVWFIYSRIKKLVYLFSDKKTDTIWENNNC